MTDEDITPRVGGFYWVYIALDPDAEFDWENDYMPARYAGDDKWFFLNKEGPIDWFVRRIDSEIIRG